MLFSQILELGLLQFLTVKDTHNTRGDHFINAIFVPLSSLFFKDIQELTIFCISFKVRDPNLIIMWDVDCTQNTHIDGTTRITCGLESDGDFIIFYRIVLTHLLIVATDLLKVLSADVQESPDRMETLIPNLIVHTTHKRFIIKDTVDVEEIVVRIQNMVSIKLQDEFSCSHRRSKIQGLGLIEELFIIDPNHLDPII